MLVRDIMKRSPLTVREEDELSTAQAIMAWAGIRHLPVLREGRLTGILSERDLLAFRAEESEWKQARVREAMHPAPQLANPEDSLNEVAERMAAGRLGALPVMEGGALVGIITTTDVLAGEVQAATAPRSPSGATARDAMTGCLMNVRADDPQVDAAARMAHHGLRHLPVLDADGRLVGVLSDRDVRSAVGDPARLANERAEIEHLRVRDAIKQPPICVREDESISRLAQLFADGRVGAVLVVDRSDRLLGMISYVDVVSSLAR
jgi:CBS domain-containing protein